MHVCSTLLLFARAPGEIVAQVADCALKYLLCCKVEEAVLDTIRSGKMTKDLAICVHNTTKVRCACCWS